MKTKILFVLVGLVGASLSACGGGSTKTQDLSQPGVLRDLATALPDLLQPGDAALPPAADMATLQGCTASSYVDHTGDAGPVAVTPWDTSSSVPRCIKIKTGQIVTWASSAVHPLIAQGAGTTPSPIPSTEMTSAASITFPNVGNYGFWCAVHQSIMEGAILVVTP
jgi:plastocyanin